MGRCCRRRRRRLRRAFVRRLPLGLAAALSSTPSSAALSTRCAVVDDGCCCCCDDCRGDDGRNDDDAVVDGDASVERRRRDRCASIGLFSAAVAGFVLLCWILQLCRGDGCGCWECGCWSAGCSSTTVGRDRSRSAHSECVSTRDSPKNDGDNGGTSITSAGGMPCTFAAASLMAHC